MRTDNNVANALLAILDQAETVSANGWTVQLSFASENDTLCAYTLINAIRHMIRHPERARETT